MTLTGSQLEKFVQALASHLHLARANGLPNVASLGDAVDLAEPLLPSATLEALLTGGLAWACQPRIVVKGKLTTSEDVLGQSLAERPDALLLVLQRGCTVVINRLQAACPSVAQVCYALERKLTKRVTATLFVTPPGRKGLHPHYDGQDVVAVQIAGSKRWTFWSPVKTNASDCDVVVDADREHATGDLVLAVGQALLVPRGIVHAAETVSEDMFSAHITFVIETATYADVLGAAFTEVLKASLFQESLPDGFAMHGPDVRVEDLRREVIATISSEGLGVAWEQVARREFWDLSRPLEGLYESLWSFGGRWQSGGSDTESEPGYLAVSESARITYRKMDDGEMLLQCNRVSRTVQAETVGLLSRLDEGARFSVVDAARLSPGVARDIESLLHEGVLTLVRDGELSSGKTE